MFRYLKFFKFLGLFVAFAGVVIVLVVVPLWVWALLAGMCFIALGLIIAISCRW